MTNHQNGSLPEQIEHVIKLLKEEGNNTAKTMHPLCKCGHFWHNHYGIPFIWDSCEKCKCRNYRKGIKYFFGVKEIG